MSRRPTLLPLDGNPALDAWRWVYGEDAHPNYWHRQDRRYAAARLSPPPTKVDWRAKPESLVSESLDDAQRRGGMWDETHLVGHVVRRVCVTTWTWAVPDERVLKAIAGYGPLTEMGAGRGYWAELLSREGVDVVAYDDKPPTALKRNAYHEQPGLYYPVGTKTMGDTATQAAFMDRVLFCCWPPYGGIAAGRAVAKYRQLGGHRFVLIGEGEGGCTGGDTLFAELEAHWEQAESFAVPQWDGIHDYLTVYDRKPTTRPGTGFGPSDEATPA